MSSVERAARRGAEVAWALSRVRFAIEAKRRAERLARLQTRSDEEGCGALFVLMRLHHQTEDWWP